MKVAVVIPARLGSTRFPGKPLAKILNMSMLGHVITNAKASQLAQDVYVATCDEAIAEEAKLHGVEPIFTSTTHSRASDRVAEADKILTSSGRIYDLIIMLQGDEPCVSGSEIDRQIQFCQSNPDIQFTNLVGSITSREEHNSPNSIKCVLSSERILYMSRLPIPGQGFLESKFLGKQVCSISFTRAGLQLFSELPEGNLEAAESIDMLRLIENGVSIGALWTDIRSHPVDVPSDIAIVERIIANLPQPGL
ncbi:3-deoxy-manno-octulosonate cytidylyltransferase [bacterium]|nr:3-deoxy-manno-octulosonate cytidylyltransferase [bacterium]